MNQGFNMAENNITRYLCEAIDQWANKIESDKELTVPTGNDYLDEIAKIFLYAMAKYMKAQRTLTEDQFVFMREGVEILAEKIQELSGDDDLLDVVFDMAFAEEPESTEELSESKDESYINAEGLEVVFQVD